MMQRSGSGWVVYGDDVDSIAFDWGVVKIVYHSTSNTGWEPM